MVYKIIKDTLINNEFLDIETIKSYINKRIDEEDINDYISKIIISGSDKCECGYNMRSKILSINPNEILYNSIDNAPSIMDMITKKEKRTGIIKNPNNVNLYNIYVINHELSHVIQNCLYNSIIEINENYYEIWKLLLMEKSFISDYYDEIYFKDYFYKKYHDYFFNEYDANINSYLETLYLLNSYKIKELNDLIIKFNRLICKNLLHLYKDIENKNKISTLSINSLKIYNQIIELMKNNNLEYCNVNFNIYKNIEKPKDEFNRLRLGLSLKKDTYKHIYNVSIGKDKTLNLFEDIRNI